VSNATDGAPGYKSGPGWDACTGLGSIDGSQLLAALKAGGTGTRKSWAERPRDQNLLWHLRMSGFPVVFATEQLRSPLGAGGNACLSMLTAEDFCFLPQKRAREL